MAGKPTLSLSPRQQWGLQGYWFSFNFQGSALLAIVVPETVLRFSSRSSHTSLLAQIATLVALTAMVMSPLTGLWSDREQGVADIASGFYGGAPDSTWQDWVVHWHPHLSLRCLDALSSRFWDRPRPSPHIKP
ncbi:MAG: hypothetical protein M0Z36_03645 [Thermaerobacter sp.]|nr:hypothetical protein [Thermaerobacter sp.]